MRYHQRIASLAILAVFTLGFPAVVRTSIHHSQEIRVERPTSEEVREVNEVARAFALRMKQSRDVSSLKDLYVDNFMKPKIDAVTRFVQTDINAEVILIPETPIAIQTPLLTQISESDWEHFYAGYLNLRYYMVLFIASRLTGNDLKDQNLTPRRIFPPTVYSLLTNNPFFAVNYSEESSVRPKYAIETIEELQQLLSTFDKVSGIVREEFSKNPPELTSAYKSNLREHPELNVDYNRIKVPDVVIADESNSGFPKGTRFFHLITADSLFELSLVKTDAGMKIDWARVYPYNLMRFLFHQLP